ncbi:dolichyl-phosphate beta-glucosyltransferase [Irineochytrium annulatum]|nr:dolichyl-phosphate beta-glucosyltransferase [Irineochytrium annulatum]
MLEVLVGIAAVAAIALFLVLALLAPVIRPPTDNELHFRDVLSNERRKFPSLLEADRRPSETKPDQEGLRKRTGKAAEDDGLVDVTVIVPAYNEKERLPAMLNEALDHLEARKRKDGLKTFEVLLVDDGSSDGTSDVARKVAAERKCGDVRILTLEKNRGKGGAIIQGMLLSRGRKILFADADGATKFSDLDTLEEKMDAVIKDGLGIAVGSRAHMVKTEAVVKRSMIRNFLMHGFHTVLVILGISSIKDTQCGFKLVTRDAARKIFPNMHVEGWIFDIEMLLLGSWQNVPMVEVPVTWHEVGGSKMSLLRDSIRMAMDLLIIRFNYMTGIWKINLEKIYKAPIEDELPGPGYYTKGNVGNFNLLEESSVSRKGYGVGFASKTKRFRKPPTDLETDLVGSPADYSTNITPTYSYSVSHSISSSFRAKIAHEAPVIPHGPRGSSAHRRFFGSNAAPGPGTYDGEVSRSKIQESGAAFVFKSKTKRADINCSEASPGRDAPPPGAYEVPDGMNKAGALAAFKGTPRPEIIPK